MWWLVAVEKGRKEELERMCGGCLPLKKAVKRDWRGGVVVVCP